MSVGERIRQRRDEIHMSAAELARRAKITKGYVSQIESGQVPRPSADVLYRLASALGTTIADLLDKEVVPAMTEVPQSLLNFADEAGLPAEDVEMLAGIKFRGRQPRSADDWRFLYESIKRTISD
jgi:transcriptional regulator with XRE-family HTH domain